LKSKNWDLDRLSAVLAHEEEHIRRHDPLVAWLALLNRCVFWFHPLAWWLCSELSALSEQSCDEAVIARGHDPSEYVGCLLELARAVKQRGALVAPWGSPLHGGTLVLRIRRIASAGSDPAMSRFRMLLVSTLCAVAALVPAICVLARAQTVAAKRAALSWQVTGAERSAATAGQFQSGSSADPANQDRVLYKAGLDLLKKHQYAKARREFQRLINSYPDSKLSASAYLAIGDAFYEEGGAENLLMAEDQYKNFTIFFPTHPMAVEARKKLIAIRNKMKKAGGDSHELLDDALPAEFAARKFVEQDSGRDSLPVVRQTYYRKWLNEDVLYIISDEEKRAFLNLMTDEERDKFIEQFWAIKNPNPGSEQNSFKQEHYRRLAYANERFACNIAGWKTDRGRIYIKYGPPDEIESRPQTRAGEFPYERWFYRHIEGIGYGVEVEFVDKDGTGNYKMTVEPNEGIRIE
jgi:GWxTD domain-containing protein